MTYRLQWGAFPRENLEFTGRAVSLPPGAWVWASPLPTPTSKLLRPVSPSSSTRLSCPPSVENTSPGPRIYPVMVDPFSIGIHRIIVPRPDLLYSPPRPSAMGSEAGPHVACPTSLLPDYGKKPATKVIPCSVVAYWDRNESATWHECCTMQVVYVKGGPGALSRAL